MWTQVDRTWKIAVMGALVAGAAFTAGTSHAAYSTSFESPTWTIGERPNVDGWLDHSSYDMEVSDAQASDGTQSVLLNYRGAGTFDSWNYFDGGTFPGTNDYIEFDFYSAAFAQNERAIWFEVLGTESYHNARFRLQYENAAAPGSAVAKKLQYRSHGGSEVSITHDNTVWLDEQWNTVRVDFDLVNQTADLRINGTLLVDDIAINGAIDPGEVDATSLGGIRILPTAASSVYIDNVKVDAVPEPASLGLLAGGILMILSSSRRRS